MVLLGIRTALKSGDLTLADKVYGKKLHLFDQFKQSDSSSSTTDQSDYVDRLKTYLCEELTTTTFTKYHPDDREIGCMIRSDNLTAKRVDDS
ncbi:hypothetical protein D915_000591 [Fasciola hepatica]|uniref:Uncharacterized protein n=1 Tax=Fasciola hepatica TaxID=6192 RepID=A0A4E0RRE3_FASHE|nr:hypothetical protein D915_000591 [Fasciola hepatica]